MNTKKPKIIVVMPVFYPKKTVRAPFNDSGTIKLKILLPEVSLSYTKMKPIHEKTRAIFHCSD